MRFMRYKSQLTTLETPSVLLMLGKHGYTNITSGGVVVLNPINDIVVVLFMSVITTITKTAKSARLIKAFGITLSKRGEVYISST